jgi:hypothetical protein
MLLNKQRLDVSVTEAAIAERAYSLWQIRGCPVGDGQEDWQDAKAQLLKEATPRRKPLQRLFSRFRNRPKLAGDSRL